jgi:hypothetical protein
MATGVAGFHTDVREFLGDVNGESLHIFFAARGADDSSVFPLVRAKRANQRAFGAVALLPKDTHLWFPEAKGAPMRGSVGRSLLGVVSEVFGVGLQECP